MYYTLVDGKIAFWTYRTSQKALNLARDPRISCLVETGEAYFDLRGVQIQGTVETITDPDAVYRIGLAIGARDGERRRRWPAPRRRQRTAMPSTSTWRSAARKRYGYLVEPVMSSRGTTPS